MSLETFSLELSAETMPPKTAWLEAEIKTHLPKKSQLLQWAIVKTDLKTNTLFIEGSVKN